MVVDIVMLIVNEFDTKIEDISFFSHHFSTIFVITKFKTNMSAVASVLKFFFESII